MKEKKINIIEEQNFIKTTGGINMKITLIAILSFFLSIAQSQDHKHHETHSKKHEKQVVTGKQFKPTDDLKVRMEKILNLMKESSKKKDDIKSIKEYGSKLTDTVNDIFKTCKLEPEADAAIHPALGLILQGANDFKKGQYESGHKKIHEALLEYEKLFKHEGWNK